LASASLRVLAACAGEVVVVTLLASVGRSAMDVAAIEAWS
jgi:hypothetical protein